MGFYLSARYDCRRWFFVYLLYIYNIFTRIPFITDLSLFLNGVYSYKKSAIYVFFIYIFREYNFRARGLLTRVHYLVHACPHSLFSLICVYSTFNIADQLRES